MPPRNPNNENLSLYEHFYLPDFGAYGASEWQSYNAQRERLDQFLREIFDKSYTLNHVLAQMNEPPDMSWFYELRSLPHWRVARGFWKFDEYTGDVYAVDNSLFGHDGGTRFTCHVRDEETAWYTVSSASSSSTSTTSMSSSSGCTVEPDIPEFDGVFQNLPENLPDTFLQLRSDVDYTAEIPGLLHSIPLAVRTEGTCGGSMSSSSNSSTSNSSSSTSASSTATDYNVDGEKALTIEFWMCPTRDICNGTYDDYAVIFSKINRAIQNVCGEWVSDELTIGFHPGDPDCAAPGAPLIFATHTFTGNCYNDTNRASCEEDCDPCVTDYTVVSSDRYSWESGVWSYVTCTWGPDGAGGRRVAIHINAEAPGSAGEAFTDSEVMSDGNLHNFLIGNHVKNATPGRAVDCLISQLRVSNRVRTAEEQAYVYNDGKGRVLEADEYTLGLYTFDDEGAFAFNDLDLQESGYPTYGEEGALVTGPAKEYTLGLLGESSSSAGSNEFGTTRAARFDRTSENYLDVGDGPFLSLPILNSQTVNKFSMAAFVKRQSLNTFQTLISKWCEDNRKQFSISFNTDNKIEVRLGTQGSSSRLVCQEVLDNGFGTVVLENAGEFDGTYVTEAGFSASSSSAGASTFVQVQGAEFEEANGDYVNAAGWAELNPGYASETFPYVEIIGAADPTLDGLYYKRAEWLAINGSSESSSSISTSSTSTSSSSTSGNAYLIVGAGAVGAPNEDVEGTYEPTGELSQDLPVWIRTGPAVVVPPASSSSNSSSSQSTSSTSTSSSSTEPRDVYVYLTNQWSGGFTSWVISTAPPDAFDPAEVLYWFIHRPDLDTFGALPPPYWYPYSTTGDGPGLEYYTADDVLLTEDEVIVAGAGYSFMDGPYVQNGVLTQWVSGASFRAAIYASAYEGVPRWYLSWYDEISGWGNYYWTLYDALVSTHVPPETGWNSILLNGAPAPTFTYTGGTTTPAVEDNLVWEVDGVPVWRKIGDPEAVIYADVLDYSTNGWDTTKHWWLGYGLGHNDDRAWGLFLDDGLPPEVWYPRHSADDSPAPRAAVHPLVFTSDGADVWRHVDRPYMAISRGIDTRRDPAFRGWFIGVGTRALLYNYVSYVVEGKTEDTPPNNWFAYESPTPPTLVKYPLVWEIDGVEVYRSIDDPLRVIFLDDNPEVGGPFWWISNGFDHLGLAYQAINSGCVSDDYVEVPTIWFDTATGDPADIEVSHTPGTATLESELIDVLVEAGAEHVTTISTDTIEDTDDYHLLVVTWFSEHNEGKPRIYIDAVEVEYDLNEPLTTDLPYVGVDGVPREDWAALNIGRDAGIDTGGDIAPGNYLDAFMDELILWATDLLPVEIEALYAHATTGLIDGDRWMVTAGSDRVYDDATKRWQYEAATGEWKGHDYEIVEWRRSPVTGYFDWRFLPINISAVYYNVQEARLESWLPDEFYERFGDYGAVGTGAFSIG